MWVIGPADDALDAGLGERGNALGRKLEPRRETVDVGRQQLGVEGPVDAVQRPRLGTRGLVRADDQTPLFLAVVARRAGVADHRRFAVERRHRGHVVGHQVLVHDVDDGNLQPDHGADPGRESAGGVDHVLGDDGTLLGGHLPCPVAAPGDVRHPIAKGDLGPAGARPGGHGIGAAGGIGVPVARRVGAEHHAVGVEERVQPGDFGRSDEMALGANAAQHALYVVKPVDLVVVGGQPDGAAPVPAGGLSGFRLEPLVELRAVEMDLGHVEAGDEMGDQSGRVPGGTGGELALLDQDHVRPPLLSQVIQQRHPHDPAADDHHARVRLHRRWYSASRGISSTKLHGRWR